MYSDKIVIECGEDFKGIVRAALDYVPKEILQGLEDNIAIFSCPSCDGKRISIEWLKNRDIINIIILPERIFYYAKNRPFSRPEGRYFVYIVLHEIAHAFKEHLPPLEVNEAEIERQENEAKDLAIEWFNSRRSGKEKKLGYDEIAKLETESDKQMKKYLNRYERRDIKKSSWAKRLLYKLFRNRT
jgi:hypothetical protein